MQSDWDHTQGNYSHNRKSISAQSEKPLRQALLQHKLNDRKVVLAVISINLNNR